MDVTVIVALITLAGVVTTAFVTWAIAQRNIAARHITAERAKWRRDIRALALFARDAMLCDDTEEVARLRHKLMVLLNPLDRQDCRLLASMAAGDDSKGKAEEFTRRVSLLLKHDWDRAKLETGFFVVRWFRKAERLTLSEADERRRNSSKRRTTYKTRWVRIVVVSLAFLLGAVVAGVAVGMTGEEPSRPSATTSGTPEPESSSEAEVAPGRGRETVPTALAGSMQLARLG